MQRPIGDRIALFVPDLAGGGAERVMAHLSNGFVRRGLHVDLLVASRSGFRQSLGDQGYLSMLDADVRVIALDAGRTVLSVPPLVRYLRAERPAVLLATLTYANIAAVWARRLAGVPTRVVIREANTISRQATTTRRARERLLPWLARRFYPWADAIVAVSEGVAEDLARTAQVPCGRVHVLDNPAITPELSELASAPADHPWLRNGSACPVVLGVGRLTAQKDFATLIRAFACARAHREARLLILGEGEQRPELARLARELGVADAVDLPGFVRNPFAYMARAAVFVLSSAWEGSPGVLIQAMASGAPVIATDCESGPREILEGGRYGQLVPVGSVEELAAAIDRALAGPRRPVPAAAWARYSLDECVDKYLRVLGVHGERRCP